MSATNRSASLQRATGAVSQDRVAADLSRLVDRLNAIPFLSGRQFSAVTIATGAGGTAIPHGLGRVPEGWIVLTRDVFGIVRELARDATILRLQADATTVIDVWVY